MSGDDFTTVPTTLLDVDYSATAYIGESGKPVCSIGTDGTVQAELERRVAEAIDREHAERTRYGLPIVRGPIQTAMAMQREITAAYRNADMVDSGDNYYCSCGTPENVAGVVNDLARQLEDRVRRWMAFQ